VQFCVQFVEISMAYIQKVQRKKGVTYRVYIHPPGLKPITKAFTTKREAVRFVKKLDLVIVDIFID